MAIKEIRLDDLNGEEGAATVQFGYQGHSYEIDLVPGNLAKLDKALAGYIAKARDVTPAARGNGDVDYAAVREWAQREGIEVSPRGRIASDVIERFKAAQSQDSEESSPTLRSVD